MRFPLSLTRTMATYLLGKKLSGAEKFPLVLMLEPLHACNLTCTGCGRIREYVDTIKDKLSVEECLASVDECGAPVVSICGGEPMIYPWIEELVTKILERKKHVYLCTNGMFIEKKLAGFQPTSRFFFNVHIDGMEKTHDTAVERKLHDDMHSAQKTCRDLELRIDADAQPRCSWFWPKALKRRLLDDDTAAVVTSASISPGVLPSQSATVTLTMSASGVSAITCKRA